MIINPLDEFAYQNLNKDFTEQERNSITQAVKILLPFSDDIMIFIGKRMENRRTSTTAIIQAKDTFQGQVAERLLKELPPDWKDYLTGGAKDI